MSQSAISHIGSVPAEEECAQLGRTPSFDRYCALEVGVYKAAIIARYGVPPAGVSLRVVWCSHDFGRYPELQAHYDPTDEVATAYATAVAEGLARWLDAGFLAPVLYGEGTRATDQNYASANEAATRVIVTLERQRIDGFGTPGEAAAIANLRSAYPDAAAQADQLLRQLATERTVRAPDHRRVQLYYPYRLTFFPALFNDHRGAAYPKGDLIDITAHELRLGRCRYIMCEIGSVRTLDDAIELCWEHMARYVIP